MAEEKPGEVKIDVVETDRTSELKEQKGRNPPREKGKKLEAKYKYWLEEMDEIITVDYGQTPLVKAPKRCIFTVPKTLKDLKGKRSAYEPQIVSLGPFHFFKNPDLQSMETIKSEVTRSIHYRMPNFFSKVVEEIQRDEIRIRNCYDREKHLDHKILPRMMARDASFILQIFRQRLVSKDSAKDTEKEDCIRDIESLPLMDTLKDIVKLENQIPLSVLKTVLRIEIETRKSEEKLNEQADTQLEAMLQLICKRLSPISHRDNFRLKNEHILECLRSYVIGPKPEHNKGKFNYFESFVYHGFQCFLWIVNIIMYPCIWKRKNDEQKILPPAVELQKAGVKFKPSSDGIRGIRFDERKSTLYLPEIKVDIHTDTVLRNIMAFELCSADAADHQNAVTRYAHLMDQLINTEKDVAALSKSNIINNKLENDSKVADLWNCLTDSTTVPKYEPINETTVNVMQYYQRKRTTLVILWNEFLEAHCSKPWHVLALVASLILLTITVSTGFLRILPAINVINTHGGT